MGQRIGSMIGAIGGVAFVLVNAGALDRPISAVVRVAGSVVFAAVVWYSVIRTRNRPAGPRPSSRALRVYWGCVAFEVVAIPLGAQVLIRVFHQPELVLVWVVFVVGVHFLPFARAFGAPLFAVLGVVLIAVATIGGLVTATASPLGSPWTGVVAGFVLLAFAGLGGLQQAPVPAQASR